nr:hypothetical protein BaRGS_010331 [Batillaria attramentaria]
MEVHNITIHIGDRLAKLQVMTDTNIKAAVTDALVAKITWDEDRERKLRELRQQHIDELRREVAKVNEEKRKVEAELEEARQEVERVRQETKKLKTQLSEAKARGLEGEKYRKELERRLQQAQERLRNAEIRVVILEQMLGEEKSKGDKRLADIIRLYEDKKRVEEQVMTFVIQVEEAHRQLLAGRHLDKQRLSDVIQRLFQQFNIRLLGADCGLRFLLDAPVSQWVKVVEKQMEVQAVLSDLIPEDARRAVAWAEVTPFGPSGEDIDLQIGRPLPVPDAFPATVSLDPIEKSVKPRRPTEQRLETRPSNRMMAFSPLTATLRRTFCVDNSQLMIQGDEEWPDIPSLVVTDKGYLSVAMDVVLVSDWSSDCVFRVEMATGRLIATHTHSELKSPRQVAADRSGNLFIASWGGRCLLVMGSDGRWRTLLTGEKNEEGEDIWPVSVAVTDTGVVVGWVDSSVTGYDLT